MSRFSGKRYQGALRDHKKKAREEARSRQALENYRDEERRKNAEYNERVALDPWGMLMPGYAVSMLSVLQGKTDMPENRVGSPYGWADSETGDIVFPNGARLYEGIDF